MSLEIHGPRVRVAVAADAAAACNVLRRAIAECCVTDHRNDSAILDAWLGNKTPQMVESWFVSPTHFSVVAELDGALAGVALLTGAGKLALCYVLPEAQRRGLGSAMLARVEEQVLCWGMKALQLHSTATGQGFFARHQYTDTGKVRSPYGVETVFFWKQLDGAADAGTETGKRKRFCNCNGG
ncbi:GNAT family acetyltransferase [Duganella sp. Leaf126]|uniref:GNAT family N-acetyltransferase n=1 Tax=Duganella sp. Leaf126 TaxID=1736266 RepID=UPI0007016410|nr:GNAT family N-acetyltransferase [Duganella sp. Leaf126]KQQ36146.1 GNAT family acetyltransferase [Duganella sp. Leaf126]